MVYISLDTTFVHVKYDENGSEVGDIIEYSLARTEEDVVKIPE